MSLGNNTEEGKKLKYIVDEVAKREEEIKGLREEIKDLKNAAPERCGISAKTVTQMVRELAFSDADRKARLVLEQEIDQARHALDMQLDMPLRGGKVAKDAKPGGGKKPAKSAKKSQRAKAQDKYNKPVKQPGDEQPTLQSSAAH